MDNYPKLMNVEDNLPAPGIEWEINVDRKQASKFGANITSIGNVIKLALTSLDRCWWFPYKNLLRKSNRKLIGSLQTNSGGFPIRIL